MVKMSSILEFEVFDFERNDTRCQLQNCYVGEDIDKGRRSTVVLFPNL